jgi:hypothetical protein
MSRKQNEMLAQSKISPSEDEKIKALLPMSAKVQQV